jgi:hypothetical protein
MGEERERRAGRREGATGERARALVDGLARLGQRRDAGAIDAAAYEAEARALVGAAPPRVVRAARQLALGVRAALRPERSGDRDEPSNAPGGPGAEDERT